MKQLPVLNGSAPKSALDMPARDKSKPVVLIGFQNQGNLGIGYLASVLRENGYQTEVIDFELDRELILERILALDPVLVGFSLIFQFYIVNYRSLIEYLREAGVDCHFTMGGHFPSLSFEKTLELVPELDSVVRFEGELTLLELVDTINLGKDWREIKGIAYRRDGEAVSSELRPLMENLDLLPYPERNYKPISVLGLDIIPLIASRGCSRTCSFFDSHFLPRCSRKNRPASEDADRGRRNEVFARKTQRENLSLSGRRFPDCRARLAAVDARFCRRTLPAKTGRQGNLENQLPRRRG